MQALAALVSSALIVVPGSLLWAGGGASHRGFADIGGRMEGPSATIAAVILNLDRRIRHHQMLSCNENAPFAHSLASDGIRLMVWLDFRP